ncbi:hypothetical protein EDD11_010058 [Mortierella claussenii]|nr:hypothetical protein EDD11_010058 [Mortierella claussenii]
MNHSAASSSSSSTAGPSSQLIDLTVPVPSRVIHPRTLPSENIEIIEIDSGDDSDHPPSYNLHSGADISGGHHHVHNDHDNSDHDEVEFLRETPAVTGGRRSLVGTTVELTFNDRANPFHGPFPPYQTLFDFFSLRTHLHHRRSQARSRTVEERRRREHRAHLLGLGGYRRSTGAAVPHIAPGAGSGPSRATGISAAAPGGSPVRSVAGDSPRDNPEAPTFLENILRFNGPPPPLPRPMALERTPPHAPSMRREPPGAHPANYADERYYNHAHTHTMRDTELADMANLNEYLLHRVFNHSHNPFRAQHYRPYWARDQDQDRNRGHSPAPRTFLPMERFGEDIADFLPFFTDDEDNGEEMAGGRGRAGDTGEWSEDEIEAQPAVPARPGHTKSLNKTIIVACPVCKKELGHGGKENTKLWVVIGCGHVICDECIEGMFVSKVTIKASRRQSLSRKSKGKGKARMTTPSITTASTADVDADMDAVAGTEKADATVICAGTKTELDTSTGTTLSATAALNDVPAATTVGTEAVQDLSAGKVKIVPRMTALCPSCQRRIKKSSIQQLYL